MSDTSAQYRARCKNICCKSMLVYGEAFESDPDYQSGQTDFWCLLTSKPLGPDGDGSFEAVGVPVWRSTVVRGVKSVQVFRSSFGAPRRSPSTSSIWPITS